MFEKTIIFAKASDENENSIQRHETSMKLPPCHPATLIKRPGATPKGCNYYRIKINNEFKPCRGDIILARASEENATRLKDQDK